MTQQERPEGLALKNLSKRYPGTVALSDVSLTFGIGEVVALLGKNGAGKSTLVKILTGATQPDSGRIFVSGQQVHLDSPLVARNHGIAAVHQEFTLLPELSVAENIMLGRCGHRGVIDFGEMRRRARAAMEELGVHLPLDEKAGRLSVADQQLVEIAKALSHRPKLLILDEPTSSLSANEANALIGVVRRLAKQGVTVLYISHRLGEIPRVADFVTVLRDGKVIETIPISSASSERVIEMMVGKDVVRQVLRRTSANADVDSAPYPNPPSAHSEVVLSIRGMSFGSRLGNVSVDLRKGEVLGLAGLVGSGRTELLRCIYGLLRADTGSVSVNGETLSHLSPRVMVSRGVALTPDDRKREGIFPDLTVADNMIMASLGRVSHFGVVSQGRKRVMAANAVHRLGVKTPSLGTPLRNLSGGNQQKVIFGRWINAGVRILLMDEPTRGVDIHSKEQIYSLLRELAGGGLSVIVAPSEFEELFAICDRIVVLKEGRIVGEVATAATSLPDVMAMAMSAA